MSIYFCQDPATRPSSLPHSFSRCSVENRSSHFAAQRFLWNLPLAVPSVPAWSAYTICRVVEYLGDAFCIRVPISQCSQRSSRFRITYEISCAVRKRQVGLTLSCFHSFPLKTVDRKIIACLQSCLQHETGGSRTCSVLHPKYPILLSSVRSSNSVAVMML